MACARGGVAGRLRDPVWLGYLRRRLGYDGEAAAGSREETRRLTAGFKPWSYGAYMDELAPASEAVTAGPEDCAALGADRLAILERALDLGFPVAVELLVRGLRGWGGEGKRLGAAHGFLVTGWRERAGRLYFQTRNSWGGNNPELAETDLCRVARVTVLLNAAERDRQELQLRSWERELTAAAGRRAELRRRFRGSAERLKALKPDVLPRSSLASEEIDLPPPPSLPPAVLAVPWPEPGFEPPKRERPAKAWWEK